MVNNELIIRFLAEAGDKGLSSNKLARHIFNVENDLFCTIDYESVRKQVDVFIRRNSQDSYSLLEKIGDTDRYRLNRNSSQFTQLSLNFLDEDPQPEQTNHEDQSLELMFE